jgi:hypothetical protein
MSNVTISQLNAASALTGVEPFPMVQGGNTLKATAAQIATYVLANPVTTGTITITQISTPATNTNLTVAPNGSGGVYLNTSLVRAGSGAANATIGSNGANDLILTTNLGAANQGTISIADGANGAIAIAPNGTGSLALSSSTINIGSGAGATTVANTGAYDLTIRTNSGAANQGLITIANGANGNITIDPDGTGYLIAATPTFQIGNGATTATITTNGANSLILRTNDAAANQASITLANGANGNITIAPDGTGQILASKAVVVTGLVSATSSIKSSSATGGVGYATGAGGTVTQTTNKTTPVTLNTMTGQITMSGSALSPSTSSAFTLNNSNIAATDTVIVNIASGATALGYVYCVDAVAAGSCEILIRNVSSGTLTDTLVLNFAIIKSVNA